MLIAAVILGILLQTQSQPVLEFPATGDENAHAEFILGIISLHSSAYDDAASHFRAAEKIDPNFVMAYWGEAMTFNHPFWNQQDISGARRALTKLGATRIARAAKAKTPRERSYLNAIELLYGDGDRDARDFSFADAMRKLSFDNPADYEAATFYVLALLSTRRVGDGNYAQTQATAAAILNAVLQKYPDHPGALHYLMHTYDDPEHAHFALDAARKYERVAVPDSNFHAVHMPSHIYAELGLWPDVVRSNQAAFDASERWVTRNKLSVAKRDYHSLEFLQYARMQMGQYSKAREALSTMQKSAQLTGIPAMSEGAAVMASRFALETEEWDVLPPLSASNRIPELLFAQGLASLKKGDNAEAKTISSTLYTLIQSDTAARRLVHATTEEGLKTLLDSRIATAEKRGADAERLASEAVQLELKLDFAAELSGIVKPAAEFYGEILLELKKPAEAAEQFAAALKQKPKRALSLLGLARSRAMLNDTEGATKAYRELAAMWIDADANAPAVREVRRFIGQ